MGKVEQVIMTKLTEAYKPLHIEVMNESYMHNVPRGSETHFKVVLVSEVFDGLTLIKRHRAVNHTLQEELDGEVHALSIQAKTPKQWETSQVVEPSPKCAGGAGK
eukprot:gene2099-11952_t